MKNIIDKEKFIEGLVEVQEVDLQNSDEITNLKFYNEEELHIVISDYLKQKIRETVNDTELDSIANDMIKQEYCSDYLKEIGICPKLIDKFWEEND